MKLQILNIGRGIKVKVNNITVVDLIDKLTELTAVKGNRDFKSVLDTNQVNTIYDLIARLFHVERKDARILYDECRDTIIDMLKAINYVPLTPNNKNKSQGQRFIPTEIKCLLWYMVYRAFELYDNLNNTAGVDKPSNQAVLDLIKTDSQGNPGFSLSKKTFEYFAISPKRYYEMCNYEQIWLPMKYAGEKTGYLGYAVNYLAQSVGVYENFLDLFGGSGYASLAIDQDTHIDYHINEYNFFNINFYKVMADEELYVQFKKEYEFIKNVFKNANYNEGTGRYYFNLYSMYKENWAVKYPDAHYSKPVENVGIMCPNFVKYLAETNDSKIKAAMAFVFLNSFKTGGGKSEHGAVKKSKLKTFCSYPIENFDKAHEKFMNLLLYNSDALYDDEFIIKGFCNRASDMYKPFDQYIKMLQVGQPLPNNLSSDEVEDIEAMAGRLGYSKRSKNKKPRNYRTLIYSDSPYLETEGYGKKQNVNAKKKKTADGNIDVDGMHTLIERLLIFSSEDNNFIFSCRATAAKMNNAYEKMNLIVNQHYNINNYQRTTNGEVSINIKDEFACLPRYKKNGDYKDTIDAGKYLNYFLKMLSSNQSIYENLFLRFRDRAKIYNKQLYILVCLKYKGAYKQFQEKSSLLNKILGVSDSLEVFITDFDFAEPFAYVASEKDEKYKFVKYTIEDFCEVLRTQLLHSSVAHEYKAKRIGSGVYKICKK